tara:strand:- start:296 stop:595 length:300 start_codon:yes stop_codon:yes gene_type:complete
MEKGGRYGRLFSLSDGLKTRHQWVKSVHILETSPRLSIFFHEKNLKKPRNDVMRAIYGQNGISFVELSARLHFVNKHDFMRAERGGTLISVGELPLEEQ